MYKQLIEAERSAYDSLGLLKDAIFLEKLLVAAITEVLPMRFFSVVILYGFERVREIRVVMLSPSLLALVALLVCPLSLLPPSLLALVALLVCPLSLLPVPSLIFSLSQFMIGICPQKTCVD